MALRFDLAGKTAVITGAASGIGRALAYELAARDVSLALVDKNAAGLDETVNAIRSQGGEATSCPADLFHHEDVNRAASEILSKHGSADILINNAGVAIGGTFEEMSLPDFEWLLRINFVATVQLTKLFLPHLKARPAARIVNISSVFGLIAPTGQTAYSASKFAVRGFSEALQHELEGSPVAVSCVFPGGVKTAIARNARVVHADKDLVAAEIAHFDKVSAITTPQDAAKTIVAGMIAGKPRIVVGRDAKRLDRLQRLLPVGYWRIVKPMVERASRPVQAKR